MTWNNFTRDEKKAVIKSAAMIANADGDINYSENMYLTSLILQMDADNQLVRDAMDMWKMNMSQRCYGYVEDEHVTHYPQHEPSKKRNSERCLAQSYEQELWRHVLGPYNSGFKFCGWTNNNLFGKQLWN